MELFLEKWLGEILTVSIGATSEEAGTRTNLIKVGGQKTLPFLFLEGQIPYKPVIAFEIWDTAPLDWPEQLIKPYKDVAGNPLEWAEKCVKEFKAELLFIRLQSVHPDFGDKGPDEEAKLIQQLLKRVKVPLIICGCGDDTKDNLVL
ncbi:MAG: acetyl-CoA decarbonylase/synthase complex subunit delta, partial [Candidatus Omnitrophica bacterium]|nr:acetyl-CoA decarbonylase/synthase complex subunit delta [Candidatus Omnitrophota bacterium]